METPPIPQTSSGIPEQTPEIPDQISVTREEDPVIRRAGRRRFAFNLSLIKDPNHFVDVSYNALVKTVVILRNKGKRRTAKQDRRLQNYDFRVINGNKRLMVKLPTGILEFLKLEEVFDYLLKCDHKTNHEGVSALRKETDGVYANVTDAMIEMYVSMCEMCHRKMKKSAQISKNILRLEVKSRGHIIIINKQADSVGEYNFIFLYQDDETKFTLLRPLVQGDAQAVAAQLMDIFSIIGVPCILNSKETVLNQAIEQLHILRPDIRLLIGDVTRNMTEKCEIAIVRRIGQIIEKHLANNPKSDWLNSLRFVQFQFNKERNNTTCSAPYTALFGVKRREGLSSLALPRMTSKYLNCEDDFVALMEEEFDIRDIGKSRFHFPSESEDNAKRPRIE